MAYHSHREGKRFYQLSEHLAETAAGAAKRLTAHPRHQQLLEAGLLAGWTHDFGKYTPFFQHYLRTGNGGPEKQHAFLSALWAAHLAQKFHLSPSISLALFISVSLHHRSLFDPEELLLPPRELDPEPWGHLEPVHSERLQITKRQIESLQKNTGAVTRSLQAAAQQTMQNLKRKKIPAPAWLKSDWAMLLEDFFDHWIQSYGQLYRFRRRQLRSPENSNMEGYFDLLSLFSSLIDADKIHAARLEDIERSDIPLKPVDRFRENKFGRPHTALNKLRNDLYNTVQRIVTKAPLSQKLFTITAPTGSGKTLAGLGAAFSLRDKLSRSENSPPRIIYALPFTSIVDQTYNTLEEVLAENREKNAPLPSSWLLKHHHLAETAYHQPNKDNEESLSLDQALMLIESWQSEIIVTTFVQLLHTLIGCQNRMLKKFHRLQNAIIILDEVQNIPVEYWPLIETVLRETCRHLEARVILMTATRPEWFSKGEALELAGSAQQTRQRFAVLNRVTITANPEPLTIEEFADKFLGQYRCDRSYLIILNTIKSSITFYNLLKTKLHREVPFFYLSTNIAPLERACRLKYIREILRQRAKPVLVSTQVVEAGVDLDFDEVWRDLGPVDAVVQAAGRCNRHFAHDNASVKVWHLVNRTEKGDTTLSQYVYGKIHTHAAKKMFEQRPSLQESSFYEIIANYFETVRQAKSAAISKKLLEAMHRWRFSRRERDSELLGVANFALIEDQPHYVSVFVELNEGASMIWQQYLDKVVGEKDFWKRRQAYLYLKHDFSKYIISIPAILVVGLLDESTSPLRIPQEMLSEFYDRETGFKRIDNERVIIF